MGSSSSTARPFTIQESGLEQHVLLPAKASRGHRTPTRSRAPSSTRCCSTTRGHRACACISRRPSSRWRSTVTACTLTSRNDAVPTTRARISGGRQRPRRLPRHAGGPSRAHPESRQGRALRPLPRRRPRAPGARRATSVSTSSRTAGSGGFRSRRRDQRGLRDARADRAGAGRVRSRRSSPR